ncbi:hypothetical protein LXA43DRAFT_1046668 [Ganoderma leucocontextum]|nr:hypothetical protein LXA43DRAFT_1046668 [Ganoderma leucocontextum]
MAFGNFDADECILMSSYPLRDQVLRRDGHQCVVSGVWDNRSRRPVPYGMLMDYVDAVRIFKHPLVVYKGVYDNDEGRRKSVMLSLEVLRRYTQLSDRYVDIQSTGDAPGVMDDPANLISLGCTTHTKFDAFGICLVPTQVPNTYRVKDHDPRFVGVTYPSITLRHTVTLQDHTGAPVDGSGDGEKPVRNILPSRELLRMHAALGGVLYTTGLAGIFDWIENYPDRKSSDVGGLPLPVPDPDGASFWKGLVDAGANSASPNLNSLARLLGIPVTPGV